MIIAWEPGTRSLEAKPQGQTGELAPIFWSCGEVHGAVLLVGILIPVLIAACVLAGLWGPTGSAAVSAAVAAPVNTGSPIPTFEVCRFANE